MELIDFKEMIEALKDKEDAEYAIQVAKDFIEALKLLNLAQVINTLSNLTADFALENNRCFECNLELTNTSWKENRPMGNTDVQEEMGCLICPNCYIEY